jgi:hypothetical protein
MLGVFSPPHLDGMFEAMLGQPLQAFQMIAAGFGCEIIGPMIEPETVNGAGSSLRRDQR